MNFVEPEIITEHGYIVRRLLFIPVLHIDTNLINSRQKLTEINQIERWFDGGVILINMSCTANQEARSGNDKTRREKAYSQIFTLSPPANKEDRDYLCVENAIFPSGAKDVNQENDVRIVCEAIRYGAILITGDGASKSQPGGILGNREKLKDMVTIFSPIESVEFIRQKIKERDDEIYKLHESKKILTLPSWVGKDL